MQIACRVLIIIFFLSFSIASYCADCNKLFKYHTLLTAKNEKVETLLAKNQKMYEKYKENVSKKIKISSNIVVLSAKQESLSLKIEKIVRKCQNKGCLKCQKSIATKKTI